MKCRWKSLLDLVTFLKDSVRYPIFQVKYSNLPKAASTICLPKTFRTSCRLSKGSKTPTSIRKNHTYRQPNRKWSSKCARKWQNKWKTSRKYTGACLILTLTCTIRRSQSTSQVSSHCSASKNQLLNNHSNSFIKIKRDSWSTKRINCSRRYTKSENKTLLSMASHSQIIRWRLCVIGWWAIPKSGPLHS